MCKLIVFSGITADRYYKLKANIPTHIINALALPRYRNRVSVVGKEILRQIQMVGIGHIGKVGAIRVKRANYLACFGVYKISANARII